MEYLNFSLIKKMNWNLKMKLTAYVIFILCMAALLQLAVNHTFISDDRLIEAFSVGNTADTEGNLSCLASYEESYLTNEDKKQMLIFLADKLGIHIEKEDWKEEADTEKQVIRIVKNAKDGDIELSFISVGKETEKQAYYIHAEIKLHDKLESLTVYKKLLCNCMKELNVREFQPLISFSGEYIGQLSEQEKEEKVQEMLSILKAETVSETTSQNTKNVYGYTEFLEEYLVVNQKRVNVNLLMTYDEARDKTILYLAAPIYNKDY